MIMRLPQLHPSQATRISRIRSPPPHLPPKQQQSKSGHIIGTRGLQLAWWGREKATRLHYTDTHVSETGLQTQAYKHRPACTLDTRMN